MSQGPDITYPPRLSLAQLPTPIQPLERLSEQLGVQLVCKRDDLSGSLLSGNKVRKLEFVLAEAQERGAVGVITCGGAQSNHCRATAAAARMLGLDSLLLLRTEDPEQPPSAQGNLLLDRLVGAEVRWITPAQYAARDELMAEEAARRAELELGLWYVIPEGASDPLGAWGYVRCAEELFRQLGRRPATVVHAVGSGGTAAGLHAGCALLGLPYRLVGVCVTDDRPTFQARIAEVLDGMGARWGVEVSKPAGDIEIWQDYVGAGYAVSRDEELALIRDMARLEGLVTDPVYSGKALYGLVSEIRGGLDLPEPVVFIHTGGIYGLFAQADQLSPLLGGRPPFNGIS